MYSRSNRDVRIPPNYGGSAFSSARREHTPVQDMTRRHPTPAPLRDAPHVVVDEAEEIDEIGERIEEECEAEGDSAPVMTQPKEKHSLLSPLGNLGSEELLLLALALIIFQGGKEPDLALILLALLFIN